MIGIWKGFYKYGNRHAQTAIGFEQTNFTVNILYFDGKYLRGFVDDDIETGGMKGTGEIVGYVKNDRLFFKKLMPKKSTIMDLKGTRLVTDKKHPAIFYSGTITENNKKVSGTWKFKPVLIFLYRWMPYLYTERGIWSMKLLE